MTDKPTDAQKFDAVVRTLLSVSHDEVKRREERWKRERAGKAKPGPKPKTAEARKGNE
jgi:hypothetical protein